MDTEAKLELIKRLPTEEIIGEEELREYLELGIPLNHYIGFEISGKPHIGSTIVSMGKVADLQKAGINCSIFLADWHAWINNKLGGDWEKIGKAVKYYRELFKISLKSVGGNPAKLKFTLGSELYHNNDNYWKLVLDIAKGMSLGRAMRSITIMGRKEKELTNLAQLFYPPMQVADIYEMEIHIAHAGMDQRKAHVIAREVANKVTVKPLTHLGKKIKPVALHHHLLLGIQKPAVWPITENMGKQEIAESFKMSKSKTGSAIYTTDSEEEIRKRIQNAFCPETVVNYNPLIDWAQNIVLRDGALRIERAKKYGGDLEIEDIETLKRIYERGELHPLDLKNAMAEVLIKKLAPIRKYFENKKELIMMMDKLTITR